MTALLLDPHGDDAALFAAFTAMREKATVAVMKPTVPEREMRRAFDELDVDFVVAPVPFYFEPEVVYVPAIHADGHEDHNEVAESAVAVYGREKVRFYETYAPRGTRTKSAYTVIAEPWMIAKKLRALSCFVSQIEDPSTRPWFYDLLDMREWVA